MRAAAKVGLTSVTAICLATGVAAVAHYGFGIGVDADQQARTAFAKSQVEVVKSTLKDPFSATFEHLVVVEHVDGQMVLCGSYNAKNSYGAYAGRTAFYSTGAIVATDGQAGFSVQFDRYCEEGGEQLFKSK